MRYSQQMTNLLDIEMAVLKDVVSLINVMIKQNDYDNNTLEELKKRITND